MRMSFLGGQVRQLPPGIPDPAQSSETLDACLLKKGYETLEELSGDVGIPDGRMCIFHRDLEGCGQVEEARRGKLEREGGVIDGPPPEPTVHG